jgi:outer membrane protein insertion porin family
LTVCNYLFAQIGEKKLVTAVEIKGNKTISNTTVLSKIKTRVGLEYSGNIISDDIKRLYSTGYFSDIDVDRQDYNDGFKVIFYLTEKPIIKSIKYTGAKHISKRKLDMLVTLKEGEFLDYQKLKADIREIKSEYDRRGFSNAKVEYNVKEDDANRADVEIVIKEEYRVRIKRINFEGNSAFPDKRLLKIIKTRPDTLFTSGFYKEETIEEDVVRLESFYKREGYIDTRVFYRIEHEFKGRMILTFTIDEGEKYTVGSIRIEGNRILSDDEIRAVLIECAPGKVFGQEQLEMDVSRIQKLYFDKGYIFAQINKTTAIDPQTNKVAIVYNIDEGEIAYVDKINIKGNVKTKDIVIRRELRIKPGERFDGEKLRRSKERLRNLGFFEDISYEIEPGSAPNRKDLVVEVKEAKTGEFSFGGGYSSVNEFGGFLEIAQRNFDFQNFPYFTGDGQELKLHAELGTLREELLLSWTEPWLFDYPISFGFDGYKTSRDRESDVGYGYNEERVGGDLRLGKELSEYIYGNMIYRYETIEISNITQEATNELKKEKGKNSISTFDMKIVRDTRDNIFDPSKGTVLSGQVGIAGGPLGGDKDFYRFIGKASIDIPIKKFRNSVLEFRARVGLIDAYGDSSEVPIYSRFFAGGTDSIRGYNERKVGPIDPVSEDPIGGESMFIGNIEYTVPIIDYLKVAAFYDTGNVWSKLSDFGKGGFKSGIGVGIRVKTPIGPLRLDYGYPLDTEPGEEAREGKFYFSMSHGF